MTVLFPNFGAEEFLFRERSDVDFKGRVTRPMFLPLAKAWRELYANAQVVGLEGVSEHSKDALPHLLQGRVSWLSTKFHPGDHARSVDAVVRFSDKLFAQQFGKACPLTKRSHAVTQAPAPLKGHTLKPRFGSSGRGRVSLESTPERIESGFKNLVKKGGALCEPWVSRECDLSAQGIVHDEGVTMLGTTLASVSDAGRVVGLSTQKRDDRYCAGTPYDDEVLKVGREVGEALYENAYRGSFCVDAFSYTFEGQTYLRAPVEINPRFTMGTLLVGLCERYERPRACFGAPREGARLVKDFGGLVFAEGAAQT